MRVPNTLGFHYPLCYNRHMYHVIWHYLQLFDYVICYIRHLHCVIWHNIHFCFTIMFISGRPFDCLIQVNFHKINHIFLQLPKYFDISDSWIETLIMLMIRASRTHYFPTSRNQWIFSALLLTMSYYYHVMSLLLTTLCWTNKKCLKWSDT